MKATPAKANAFQEMVRTRLRERTNITALAKFLGIKNPSVLYKRFRAGGSALCLDWLDEVTAFYQMSVSEMCALPGAHWQQVTPAEAELLTHFRSLTHTQRTGLLAVLEARLTQPAMQRHARWGRAELTEEQQLLVDLYVRSEPQAREGVLKVLRGTARKAEHDGPQTDDTDE